MRMRMSAMKVAPFVVMVIMEGCTIGLTILAKTAMSNGMSLFVFIAYTNALSTLILLPYSFFFHRNGNQEAAISCRLLLRIFFLGLTGITIAQYLSFIGLYYSSPILVCAMGLLIPMFSYLSAIILRTIKLDWGSSNQAKIIGTLISTVGAISVLIYEGPAAKESLVLSLHRVQQQRKQPLVSFTICRDWVVGGILLAGSSLSVSVSNIIQVRTLELYPQELKLVSFYSLIGTFLCVVVSLAAERNLCAWKLKLNFELALIISTAVFGGLIRSSVQVWCMQVKGPLYVPLFKPLGIFYATLFGACFFASTLHYGSVIGALVTGVGYYAMMWGQIKGETRDTCEGPNGDSWDNKVPLLLDETQD